METDETNGDLLKRINTFYIDIKKFDVQSLDHEFPIQNRTCISLLCAQTFSWEIRVVFCFFGLIRRI